MKLGKETLFHVHSMLFGENLEIKKIEIARTPSNIYTLYI